MQPGFFRLHSGLRLSEMNHQMKNHQMNSEDEEIMNLSEQPTRAYETSDLNLASFSVLL